jgi:hypothetical protein
MKKTRVCYFWTWTLKDKYAKALYSPNSCGIETPDIIPGLFNFVSEILKTSFVLNLENLQKSLVKELRAPLSIMQSPYAKEYSWIR